jgi:hypothetical protein
MERKGERERREKWRDRDRDRETEVERQGTETETETERHRERRERGREGERERSGRTSCATCSSALLYSLHLCIVFPSLSPRSADLSLIRTSALITVVVVSPVSISLPPVPASVSWQDGSEE